MIGSLILRAFLNNVDDENRDATVEGGPLIVALVSVSALMYALLLRGIDYKRTDLASDEIVREIEFTHTILVE